MPANTSAWSKSQPSGSSSIRDGDDTIRSDKSVLEATLNSEHYFDPQGSASSASGGAHRPGSARLFYGARASLATPSSADSEGRLYLATDTGALLYMHASSTSTIAGGSQPAGFSVVHRTTLVASGSTVAVSFGAPIYDVGGYMSFSSSEASVPLAHAGTHVFTASIDVPSSATNARFTLGIRKNGATIPLALNSISSHGGISVSFVDRAAVADKYDVIFRHEVGVNFSINSGYFSATRVV